MSLVGDALRKARREAAERDAERRGVLYSARISDPPARSNLGLGLVLGAVIAVVATAAGGTVAWWLLRGEGPGPVPPAAVTAVPGPSTTRARPPGNDPDTAFESAVPAAVTEPEAATASPAAAPAPASPKPSSDQVRTGSTPSAPSTAPVTAAPPADTDDADDDRPRQGFAGVEDGAEVFILEADLGGTVLSLDYIVSRTEDPFAEVNGVEVHLGGVVDGFRVKAIEHDRVVLSDGRRTIVLRTP